MYYKEYESPVAYGTESRHKVKSSIEIKMYFDLKSGLRFCVSTPNFSSTNRNPFTSIFRVMEHESIGMSKYDRIKEDSRRLGLWKRLDCR